MLFLLAKYAITAFIIVMASEVAKRTDRWGALISSLPFVTIMIMTWLYFEKQGSEKIAAHALYTFWFVLPTLPMFLVMPWMLRQGIGYGWSLLAGVFVTLVCFAIAAWVGKSFNIHLF